MCGRFNVIDSPGLQQLLQDLGIDLKLPSKANIAPTEAVPLVREGEFGRELSAAHWWLTPSWAPSVDQKYSMFNARSETIATSNTFRGSFRHKRCLIPVSGFYEWTGQKGSKTPFAIGLRNRRWFCFAGLWDRATIDGSEIDSFTILTTEPNDLMAGLHTRMPVILDPQDYERWLDTSSRDVEDLYEPFPTDAMHAWAVAPAVGNVRNQGPELIEEV